MATTQQTQQKPTNTPAAAKKPRAPPTYKGQAARILKSLERATRSAETLQRSSRVEGSHAQVDAFQKAVNAHLERFANALKPYTKTASARSGVASEIPDN